MDELNGDSDEKQESSPLSATNEDGTMSESPGCSGQAINGSPSHSSNRNRRKARPKKVIIEENENTQENNWLGEDCSEEPPMAAESMHSAEPIPTSSGLSSFSNQIPTEQLLKSFTDALAGKVDVQMLLNQMIAGASTSSLPPEAMGLSSSSNFISNLDTDDACTSSTESDLHSVSQQMMSAVAQQQLAALTAVASMTPVTPNSSSSPLSSTPSKGSIAQFQFGSLDSLSSSSTSRQLGGTQQKPQKRKLFDASRQPSQSSLRGDQMTRDERIEIEDLEQFAAMFKKQRIKFGFTQGDVGQALGRRYGTDFSQTTISRFEAMNLSFKNMCKLRPLLKEWLSDAERALANGASLTELIDNHTGSVQVRTINHSAPFHYLSSPDLSPLSNHLQFIPNQSPMLKHSHTNSLSSIELCWSCDSLDELYTPEIRGCHRSQTPVTPKSIRYTSTNAPVPSLVRTLCEPQFVLHSTPLPSKFRRSPLQYDLHLEQDLPLPRRKRATAIKKILSSLKFQPWKNLKKTVTPLEKETVVDLKSCLEKALNEDNEISFEAYIAASQPEPPTIIPGDHSLLTNQGPSDEDPDANEWTNHTWNGSERPSLQEVGCEWKTFWNHDCWNGNYFNNGLTWRGKGGLWELPGIFQKEDEDRISEWNSVTTATAGAIGWEVVDDVLDVLHDFEQLDV